MPFCMRCVLAVSLVSGLAACSNLPTLSAVAFEAPELKADRASLQGKGLSEGYINGHVDGCSTGYKSAGNPDFAFSRDSPRYGTEDYMAGWNVGFVLCKSRYQDYANHAAPPAEKE